MSETGDCFTSRAQRSIAGSLWVGASDAMVLLIVRLPCLAWGAAANQDISLASDTWASTLGRGFPVTGVHTYTHPHPRTHAHTQVTTRRNQSLGVLPSWIGRGGSVRVHRVCQSPKREAWPHDYVGVFPQHTTGNKHRYR